MSRHPLDEGGARTTIAGCKDDPSKCFIVLVVALLLPGVTLGGAASTASSIFSVSDVSDGGGVILELLVGLSLGYGGNRLRLRGAMLFGGMLSASVFHLTHSVTGQLPPGIFIAGPIALGALMGQRFEGTDLRVIQRAIKPSAGAFRQPGALVPPNGAQCVPLDP